MTHRIELDLTRALVDEPAGGHNRFHPDIEPVLRVSPGDIVDLDIRDGMDQQITTQTSSQDIPDVEGRRGHPLTGPIYVEGAEPGDLLEVETLEIQPGSYGWTSILPDFCFLAGELPDPFVVHWTIEDNVARSAELPGVAIEGRPFLGTVGVAPSLEQIEEFTARERELAGRGGLVPLPDATCAVPAGEPIASVGLRTVPPRENGGNMDVKQITKGSTLQLPVSVDGALFSVGDGHFAQGDGEVCVTAVEMGATAVVKFKVIKGAGKSLARGPRFRHRDYFAPPEWAAPKRFLAATGMPIRDDGVNEGENLTLACRNALLNMIDLLQERGWTREQAYVISSVAVDLRVSNVVDVPNYVVSALIPEAIFDR
jgi:formamidase